MTTNKGRSVVTDRPFYKGEFVCHYDGELIDEKEARKRYEEYSEEKGSYMFSFQHEGKKFWSAHSIIAKLNMLDWLKRTLLG